jgi:predicted  nucleic acid-binding Zn-ribbon protein
MKALTTLILLVTVFLSCSNKSDTQLENCQTELSELKSKNDELLIELEKTKQKLQDAEFELFQFGGFQYTKSYNGEITHYYEDIRAALDRAEDDIDNLEEEIRRLEDEIRVLRYRSIN